MCNDGETHSFVRCLLPSLAALDRRDKGRLALERVGLVAPESDEGEDDARPNKVRNTTWYPLRDMCSTGLLRHDSMKP